MKIALVRLNNKSRKGEYLRITDQKGHGYYRIRRGVPYQEYIKARNKKQKLEKHLGDYYKITPKNRIKVWDGTKMTWMEYKTGYSVESYKEAAKLIRKKKLTKKETGTFLRRFNRTGIGGYGTRKADVMRTIRGARALRSLFKKGAKTQTFRHSDDISISLKDLNNNKAFFTKILGPFIKKKGFLKRAISNHQKLLKNVFYEVRFLDNSGSCRLRQQFRGTDNRRLYRQIIKVWEKAKNGQISYGDNDIWTEKNEKTCIKTFAYEPKELNRNLKTVEIDVIYTNKV